MAKRLGLTYSRVWQMCRDGVLKHERHGKIILIPEDQLAVAKARWKGPGPQEGTEYRPRKKPKRR